MKRNRIVWVLAACLAGSVVSNQRPSLGQEDGRVPVARSVGGSRVCANHPERGLLEIRAFLSEADSSGPAATSAASLSVDVQPFRADRSSQAGDFRAVYILPGLRHGGGVHAASGSGWEWVYSISHPSIGEDGTKVGFVAGASGSFRIQGSNFVELAWRRIRNVNGLSANVYMLQMVRTIQACSRLSHLPDPDLDPLFSRQKLHQLFGVGLAEVVGIEDPGPESSGGIGHHLRSHGVGEVHGEEGHVDVLGGPSSPGCSPCLLPHRPEGHRR